jgi:hypothetical protein
LLWIAAERGCRDELRAATARRAPAGCHTGGRCGGLFAADGADEEGTLERLKALRRELLDPKIAENRMFLYTGLRLAAGKAS